MRAFAMIIPSAVAFVVAAAQPAPAADNAATSIQQNSEGSCSPPIVNNSGHVTITCPGIDEKALRYLESQLSEQYRQLREQMNCQDDSSRTIRNLNDLNENVRKQAEDWEHRYRELLARLDDSEPAKQARESI